MTGYGIIVPTPQGPRSHEAGVIRSAAGRGSADLAERIRILYDGLVEVLEECKPTVMVVEQLYAHYDHPRTAILMAHARGAFLLAATQRNIPTLSYASTRVKKTITGHGRADKEQVQTAITRELHLAKAPEPHDVTDALAVALCHYYNSANSIMGGSRSATFTGVNRQALLGPDADNQPPAGA